MTKNCTAVKPADVGGYRRTAYAMRVLELFERQE